MGLDMCLFAAGKAGRKLQLIGILLFVAVVLSSLSFAATKSSTFFTEFQANPLSNSQVNISSTLSAFILPESKQTLQDSAQTGQIDPSLISSNYALSPVSGQAVTAYLVDAADPENQVKLCSWTTDSEGKGQCLVTVTAKEATVKVRFEGNSTLFPTQRFETLFSPSIFSFTEIVDSSWLVVFLFIGILAASLYASGRKPLSAFDITTPNVKGMGKPGVIKLSVNTKSIAIKKTALSAFTPVAAAFYKAKNVDMNSLPVVNTLEKYTPGNKSSELMDVYKSRSEQERMLLIARKINELGVRNKMISNLSTARGALKSLEKRRAKLENISSKVKSREEKLIAERSKRRIDDMINKYTKQIKEYEADFKNLSGVALARVAEIDRIEPKKIRDLVKQADSAIISEYSRVAENPSNATKPGFFESVREGLSERIGKEFSESKQLGEKIDAVVQAKLELDRLYYSELSEALSQVNKNELSILEDPEDSLRHKAIFSPSTSESERIDSLVEVLKGHNEDMSKRFKEEISMIKAAKDDLDRSTNKFLNSLNSYKISSKDALEVNAFHSLVSFGMLANKSEGLLADIRGGGRKFISEYPVFDPKVAKQIVSIYRPSK